ncbi:MAG: WXG100 family type VII secretion target [Defluviitaleaceae bacterium]|nr:WXG100 family type VII secretion target [Defluviitaleaceae bacterium]
MNNSNIKFDLTRADISAKKIKAQADAVKKTADKLKRAVDDANSWWAGDSRNGFNKRSTELLALLKKVNADLADMSGDIALIAKNKRDENSELRKKLLETISNGALNGVVQSTTLGAATGYGGLLGGGVIQGVAIGISNLKNQAE